MRKATAFILAVLMMLTLASSALAATPSVSGVVRDQAGRPVVGAQVELYELNTGLTEVTVSAMDGTFALHRAAGAGTLWQIRTSATGYSVEETGWFSPAMRSYQTVQLSPVAGELHLSVRTRAGQRVTGQALLIGPGEQLVAERELDGDLKLTGLAAARYRLLVLASGFGALAQDVTVEAGRSAVLALVAEEAGMTVSGEVADAVTHTVLTNATVEVLDDSNQVLAVGRTNGVGRFQVALAGAPTSYRVRATAPGYRSAETASGVAQAGRDRDFSGSERLALQPLHATVAGTVLTSDRMPAIQAQVVLHLKGFGEVATTATDRDGNFRFANVPAAAEHLYRITVDEVIDYGSRGWSGKVATEWFGLTPGLSTHLVINAVAASSAPMGVTTVSGQIFTPQGAPIEGATVELIRNTRVAYTAETGADGAFSISQVQATGMQTTPYSVRVSKPGFVTTREFTLSDQLQDELYTQGSVKMAIQATLRPESADLRGRVLDDRGRPVAKAAVKLTSDGGVTVASATSDQGGWYTLTGVALKPAGRYELQATASGYLSVGDVNATTAVLSGGSLPTITMAPATATLTGQVLGPGGKALTGAAVQLRGPGGQMLAQATTDSGGLYRLELLGVWAGPLVLKAEATGWSSTAVEITKVPAAGETATRDLLLLPATASVEGRVLAADGRPMPGVTVDLMAEGRGMIGTAVTDATGRYRFTDVAMQGGWIWLRTRSQEVTLAGSLTHQTEGVPLLRLEPGEGLTVDLLVRPK